MASLFWVGGSTAYDGVTNRLATTSGGTATVAIINAADTVTFDANSPAAAAVTTSAAISSTNLTLTTGFTGSLTMSNALTVSGTVTHMQGTLNTNSQTCSWGSYTNNSSSSTRTLTMGSSAITCSSASAFTINTAAGMTITANTATITFSGANANAPGGGAIGYSGASFVYSGGGTMTWNGSGPIVNLTVTGTATKTNLFGYSGNLTITGTWTLGGNSTTGVNRLHVFSNTSGAQRTITMTGGAVVITGDTDWQDINITGSPSWTNAGAAFIGDCGNNGSLITSNATTPAAQTWSGTAGGNWSTNLWTTRVPLPQDNVTISSAFSAAQTITADMPRLGANIDFTGTTGAPIFKYTTVAAYGNFTFVSGILTTGSSGGLTLAGRGNQTFTSAGVNLLSSPIFNSGTGTYSLQDDLTILSTSFQLSSGTLTTNNHTIQATAFISVGGSSRTMNCGSSTVNLTGTGTVINISSWSGSFNAGTSTWVLTDTSSSTKTIVPGGANIHFWNFTTAGGTGAVSLNTGAGQTWNVDNTSLVNAPTNIIFHGGFTYRFGGLTTNNAPGGALGYMRLPGAVGNYAAMPDSTATAIPGDVDIRVRTAQDSWKATATAALVAQGTFGTDRAFGFFVQASTGNLRFIWGSVGTVNAADVQSTAGNSFANGAVGWTRVTRNATTGDITFYTSSTNTNDPTAVVWTQLGTTLTAQPTGAIFNSSNVFEFGSSLQGTAAANMLPQNYYRAAIYTTIGGSTPILDVDFTSRPAFARTFTESSANAATVTVSGAGALADGRVALFSDTTGTPFIISKSTGYVIVDNVNIQDSTATGGAGFYAGVNSLDVSGNTGWHFGGVPVYSPPSPISINGSAIASPNILTEGIPQVQSEVMSINGSLQRNHISQKKTASLEYHDLTPTEYQALIAVFTTGGPVTYLNTQSNYGTLSFNALATFEEQPYEVGGSLLRDLKVDLQEA